MIESAKISPTLLAREKTGCNIKKREFQENVTVSQLPFHSGPSVGYNMKFDSSAYTRFLPSFFPKTSMNRHSQVSYFRFQRIRDAGDQLLLLEMYVLINGAGLTIYMGLTI